MPEFGVPGPPKWCISWFKGLGRVGRSRMCSLLTDATTKQLLTNGGRLADQVVYVSAFPLALYDSRRTYFDTKLITSGII